MELRHLDDLTPTLQAEAIGRKPDFIADRPIAIQGGLKENAIQRANGRLGQTRVIVVGEDRDLANPSVGQHFDQQEYSSLFAGPAAGFGIRWRDELLPAAQPGTNTGDAGGRRAAVAGGCAALAVLTQVAAAGSSCIGG